jgi:hypothetical protein
MYLMGSIHLSYEQNFRDLFQALAQVRDQRPDLDVSMVLRGGFPFQVDTAGIPVEVRPWGSQDAVHADLEDVDALYLPLPFDERHDSFARYSLSTKLVTYVGSGVPIVYHGPHESAAAKLLREFDAGAMATDAGPSALASAIALAASNGEALARGALDLARNHFMLDDLRREYWGALLALADRAAIARSVGPVTAGAA